MSDEEEGEARLNHNSAADTEPASQERSKTEESQSVKSSGRRKKLDANALLAWAGLLVGIVGLLTGYIYYIKTISFPEIIWWSTSQIVFNAQNSNPDIRVLDRSGRQIEHNIYATNVSVSNTGTALLEHANVVGSLVRSPLEIDLQPDGTRILGASVVDVTKQSPVNLKCWTAESRISFTWDHFDPGAGFRMLLLYEAARELPVNVNITVVGMQNTTRVDLTQQTKQVPVPPETDTSFEWLSAMVGLTFLGLLGYTIIWMVVELDKRLGLSEKRKEIKKYSNETLLPSLENFLESKALPFFERHKPILSVPGYLLLFIFKAIYYLWLPSAAVAAAFLVLQYHSTILAFWRYNFPSNQPPLAIEAPVQNGICPHA